MGGLCLLFLQLIMFIWGIYALIAGKLKLSNNFMLEGRRARIVGFGILIPLPLHLLLLVVIAVLVELGPLSESAHIMGTVISCLSVLAVLGAAILFAAYTKPNTAKENISIPPPRSHAERGNEADTSMPPKKQETSPLVASAIGWMYGHRDLLNKGYSGEDPTFSRAKAEFLRGRGNLSTNEKDELIKAFEEALKRV